MKKHGLSLVEILIAAAILLSAMIPLWGLMGSSNKQVLRSSDEVKASQIVVEILEQLENHKVVACLPEEGNEEEYSLTSGGDLVIGSTPSVTVKVGQFEDYFEPRLFISASAMYDGISGETEIGRVVSLTLSFKSKEGRNLDYVMRGFIGGK